MRVCPECDFTSDEVYARHCPYDGATLEPDRLLGRSLAGRLLVEERIGTGAMGAVYRAYQPSMRRPVAVKVVRADLVQDDHFVRRFLDEVRAVSKISHPNVVCVYDCGETSDGLLFLAMELVDGKPLSEILSLTPSFEPARIERLLSQVCDSLAAAHAKGVLHGDLKPENIMVSQPAWAEDVVKVYDFGLARFFTTAHPKAVNQDGTVSGTPEYMSPECASGDPVDVRSDIYSLGILLYELLSGCVPFVGNSTPEVMIQQVKLEAPPLSEEHPQHLRELAHRALEKDAAKRPQTIREFKKLLLPRSGGSQSDIRIRPRRSASAG